MQKAQFLLHQLDKTRGYLQIPKSTVKAEIPKGLYVQWSQSLINAEHAHRH